MGFYDADKQPTRDNATEPCRRCAAKVRLGKGYCDTCIRDMQAEREEEARQRYAAAFASGGEVGGGFTVVFPGDRRDGEECPTDAAIEAPVAGQKFGAVWVVLPNGDQLVAVPDGAASAYRRQVERRAWR